MTKSITASQVGFCTVDANADVIASNLVHRASEATAELESTINRLFRGRLAYELSASELRDLAKVASRFDYMAKTARDELAAQGELRAGEPLLALIAAE